MAKRAIPRALHRGITVLFCLVVCSLVLNDPVHAQQSERPEERLAAELRSFLRRHPIDAVPLIGCQGLGLPDPRWRGARLLIAFEKRADDEGAGFLRTLRCKNLVLPPTLTDWPQPMLPGLYAAVVRAGDAPGRFAVDAVLGPYTADKQQALLDAIGSVRCDRREEPAAREECPR